MTYLIIGIICFLIGYFIGVASAFNKFLKMQEEDEDEDLEEFLFDLEEEHEALLAHAIQEDRLSSIEEDIAILEENFDSDLCDFQEFSTEKLSDFEERLDALELCVVDLLVQVQPKKKK